MFDKKTASKPIRILQYIGSLDSGGSQAMILNIYKNIDREKIQFDFIIDRKNELFYKKDVEALGGKIYVFDEYFKGINYLKYVKQWKNFFRTHPEYRIIHCHVRSVASIVLKIAKKYGLKTICHSHSTSNGGGVKAIVKKILQSNIKNHCDYYFACSKEAAEWLFGTKIAGSNKCYIVNNAVEAEKYRFNQTYRDEIRRKYLVDNDTYLIGHVGRFERPKNHDFIFDLIKVTRDNGIKYMLCGDGSRKTDFEKKVRDYGLGDRIIFVPGNNEIFKYYSAFDYFILPSLYEGLGMVLVEAQFSGLSCLVSPNIPKEAKISNQYKIEDLSVDKWRKQIVLKKKNPTRGNVELLPSAKKYDVKKTAKILETFYLQHSERHEGVQ